MARSCTHTLLLRALLLASAAPNAAVGDTYKNCTSADVWAKETQSFDLSGCAHLNLTAFTVDAEAFALALSVTGNSLESLRLVNNGIRADGASKLADALADHASLTKIHLDLNNISSGADSIARALYGNTVLKDLTISRADIRNPGAVAISEMLRNNGAISRLNLEMNDISIPGLAALGGALQENTALRSLHIGINPVFENGAAQLAKALKKNTALQELNLRYSGIQDGGAVALAGALQQNRVLRDLDVWYNVIGDAGAASLGHMLKLNKGLVRLNMWHNNLTDTGVQSLARGLAKNRHLQSLHLGRNELLTDASAVHMQKTLSVNEKLSFLDFGVGHTQIDAQFETPLTVACDCNRQLGAATRGLANGDAKIATLRRETAECRTLALKQMPLRVSIKEMMRKQGIDPEAKKKEAAERRKDLEKLKKDMETLTPEMQQEVRRITGEYKQYLDKAKKDGATAEQLAKPQFVDEVVSKAKGEEAPGQPQKKWRATREQQEKKRAQKASKEEL